MVGGQKPGIWQKMIEALTRGGAKTKEGTVNAFLFQAMVGRLLEEFHALGGYTGRIDIRPLEALASQRAVCWKFYRSKRNFSKR